MSACPQSYQVAGPLRRGFFQKLFEGKVEPRDEVTHFRVVLQEYTEEGLFSRWFSSIEMPSEINEHIPYSLEYVATGHSPGPPVGRTKEGVLKAALKRIAADPGYHPGRSVVEVRVAKPRRTIAHA